MWPGLFIVAFFGALFALWIFFKIVVVVPQQNAFVVERLGKFSGVLDAGMHILVPFMDVIRYRHILKEQAMDIPEQVCITKDNVQVAVDGILYLKIMDPERRRDLYHKINRLWIEDAAAMPLYQQLDLYGATRRLTWKARGDERIKGYDMAVKDGK